MLDFLIPAGTVAFSFVAGFFACSALRVARGDADE